MKIFLLIFMLGSNLISDTAVYKCTDMKDKSFQIYFNIDKDSLHYRNSNHSFVFKYTSTTEEKNDLLVHFFSQKNIYYTVTQQRNNPKMIYIDDFKNNKLRYQYKCFYHQSIDGSNENGIPITWKKY